MSDLDEQHATVLEEYHALRDQMREAIERARATGDFSDYKTKQKRLAKLKLREKTLRDQISARNQAARSAASARQLRREEMFIDLAKRRLGEEAFRELWAEVDRLERDQWQQTWKDP
jgi:hypothetical protein